uniref:ShKT domain-containing protein n=1 Tax=Caenorhabditis tropicalis TaxID=1561998 RepID=A0A1I7TVV3_9PELO
MLLFLALLVFQCSAAPDTDCQVMENNIYTWTSQATGCENNIGDANCDYTYGSVTLSPGSSFERPRLCYQAPNSQGVWVDNPAQKNGAIANCAKKCGYCCKTVGYTCPKRNIPNVPLSIQKICEEVTWDKCLYSIENRPIYAFYCPNTCGFCDINDCIDAVPTCSMNPSICTSMQEFGTKYCEHTCGICTQCPDTLSNCTQWKNQGLCTTYGDSFIKRYCGKTCGLC